MSFAAVQKHVAVLERAGLIKKQRIGRRKVVRTNLEALLVARRLLAQYEELWRRRRGPKDRASAGAAAAHPTRGAKGSKPRPGPASPTTPRSSPLPLQANTIPPS